MNQGSYENDRESYWSKKHNNLKFLSIKSVVRNKKIIIKKTIMPSPFIESSTANLLEEKDVRSLTEGNKHASEKNCQANINNTNVVNIQFRNIPVSTEKTSGINYDPRFRKKYANTSHQEEIRKYSLNAQQRIFEAPDFEDALQIEPLSKQKEMPHTSERKKGFYHYITLTKKKPKSKKKLDVIGSHRTISQLKPVGKKIPLTSDFEREKIGNRRTVTAFSKKVNADNILQGQKTWYISKERNISPKKENTKKQAEKEQYEAVLKQFRDFLPLRKPITKKEYFVFSMSEKPSTEPENKIQFYRDFLWKINFSNSLYVLTPQNIDFSYKAYFGPGNNSCMLKSIMRRRTWWNILETSSSIENCQFVWTQLKINSFFKQQICREQPVTENQDPQIKEHYLLARKAKIKEEQEEEVLLQIAHSKILNSNDWSNFERFYEKNKKTEQKFTEQTYLKRLHLFANKEVGKIGQSNKLKVHNHLEFNFYLGNKKALFYNMKRLCECKGINPFDYIPLTYHLSKGVNSEEYQKFLNHYLEFDEKKKHDKNFKNIWIAKPGENSNRGNGISVCFGIDDIRHRLRGKQKNGDGKPRTFILQKYIQKPFLYKGRKFDIRHYMLLTCFNGKIKAYWFEEGYIRTSSSPFCLKNSKDVLVHLTNDAVQKKSQLYGKFEKGNKISYEEFQKYLDLNYKKKKYNFLEKTMKKMKEISLLAVESTFSLLDPNRRENNFQLIGFDFMIDENFHPWLIEANTNPCLELSCPLLEKIIPSLIQQTFRICIDPFFPPPENFINKKQFFGDNPLLDNKFELIFDEVTDGEKIKKLISNADEKQSEQFKRAIGKIQEDDETFEDDGDDKWEQKN